nr:hypothetical protein CFP56_70981 [Quercus suber]
MGAQLPEPKGRESTRTAFNDIEIQPASNGASASGHSNQGQKVMIVGDSMTHGSQGDYTWRYRIWEWFRESEAPVSFVGPWVGTQEPDGPSPPKPPRLPSDPPPPEGPRTSGGYAEDVSTDFDSNHFSCWGYAAAQARDAVKEKVEKHKPDLILTMLGFNDMGWFISDANGTFESMEIFVRNARAANPKVSFALGNVPQRTFMEGRKDLVENTTKFNEMLKDACPKWSTADSRVSYVDIAEHYICETGAYDGLHPNALGDFQIAKAFSITLLKDYGIGRSPLSIPSNIPKRHLPVPSNVLAEGAPMGVKVTWDAVYGAMFYEVRHRQKGSEHWQDSKVGSNRYDTVYPSPGETWEYQVRAGYAEQHGEWSHTVHAISKRETAPAPPNVKVHATAKGFDITWGDELEKSWEVDRYEIIWHDTDLKGAFIGGVSARGTSHSVDSLIADHRHNVWMATWTTKGGGLRHGVRPVFVGRGDPTAPKDVNVEAEKPHYAKLTWEAPENAAGYIAFVRKAGDASSKWQEGGVFTETHRGIGHLKPHVKDYEFCVVAVNGEAESKCEHWVTAK